MSLKTLLSGYCVQEKNKLYQKAQAMQGAWGRETAPQKPVEDVRDILSQDCSHLGVATPLCHNSTQVLLLPEQAQIYLSLPSPP